MELKVSLEIGYLPLISVGIVMQIMAKRKRRNDSSNMGRNDFSPPWSVLPCSRTTQTRNPCMPTVSRQGFETDDTPPFTAGVADVWNFVSTHPPLPNAFVVRTRATLALLDMGCALDVNLILSLRSWSAALISVSVHTALKIITPPFHKIQTNPYFWTFPIVLIVARLFRTTTLICLVILLRCISCKYYVTSTVLLIVLFLLLIVLFFC